MVDSRPNHADQLTGNVDRLQRRTLVVTTIPLLRTPLHLRNIVGRQGKMFETSTSSYSPGRNEVVQRQRVEGSESTSRTLHGLIDRFGRRIHTIRVISSGPRVLDVVPRLEMLEALCTSIVDVLGIGDELGRRRRSVGSRHFEWRTG